MPESAPTNGFRGMGHVIRAYQRFQAGVMNRFRIVLIADAAVKIAEHAGLTKAK